MHSLICTNPKCKKPFESKRSDTKACSAACRKALSRGIDEMAASVPVSKAPTDQLWTADIENFCNKNNTTPQELMDFYRKYKPKVALLGLDQKRLVTDTPGPNLTYLEQRRKIKQGSK